MAKKIIEVLAPPIPKPPFHPCEGTLKSYPYLTAEYKTRRRANLKQTDNPELCGRRSAYTIEGKNYCRVHAGSAAIEYLQKQDERPLSVNGTYLQYKIIDRLKEMVQYHRQELEKSPNSRHGHSLLVLKGAIEMVAGLDMEERDVMSNSDTGELEDHNEPVAEIIAEYVEQCANEQRDKNMPKLLVQTLKDLAHHIRVGHYR